MKTYIVLAALISLVACFDSKAQGIDNKFGAGIMLGEPTGLSFQQRDGDKLYDLGLSYDFDEEFTIIADYKKRFPDWITAIPRTSAYLGFGLYVDYDDHHHHRHNHGHDHDHHHLDAGVRVPVGVEHILANVPVGFFLELAPSINLISDVDFGMMGAIGGRYYF